MLRNLFLALFLLSAPFAFAEAAPHCPSCMRLESLAKEMKRVRPSTTDAGAVKKQMDLVERAGKQVGATLKEPGALDSPRVESILKVIASAAPIDPRHNVVAMNFKALQPHLEKLINEVNRLEKGGALTKEEAVSIKIAFAAVEEEFTQGNRGARK